MKEMAAIILLVVLIGVGWNQPYKAHFTSVVGEPAPAVGVPVSAPAPPAPGAAAPAPTEAAPARDSSWLWKKGTLDRQEKEGGTPGGGKHGR